MIKGQGRSCGSEITAVTLENNLASLTGEVGGLAVPLLGILSRKSLAHGQKGTDTQIFINIEE